MCVGVIYVKVDLLLLQCWELYDPLVLLQKEIENIPHLIYSEANISFETEPEDGIALMHHMHGLIVRYPIQNFGFFGGIKIHFWTITFFSKINIHTYIYSRMPLTR